MMFCGKCGGQIDSDSRFCRHCGAAQEDAKSIAEPVDAPEQRLPPATPVSRGWVFGGLGLGALVLIVAIGVSNPSHEPSTRIESVTDNADMMADNIDAAADAMDAAAANAAAAAAATTVPEDNWTYRSDEDKVRGGISYYASTTSTNTIRQAPPYDPDTSMRMTVRKHPAYGTDVVLTISSGQFMCPSYEGCSGTVRFDDGKAQHINFNGPEDNSSDTIFVVGAKSFIAKLKGAKKVIIEKTLYEAGNPQFEFDVKGLKWAH